jgi:heme oxygenase
VVIPTYELVGTKEAKKAEQEEEVAEEVATDTAAVLDLESEVGGESPAAATAPTRKSTVHLIERAIARLIRAGGRKTEAEAAHLLEGIAVVVYDPDKATLHAKIPTPGSGLRWDEFIKSLADAYKARFED